MEALFRDLECCEVIVDDILVCRKDDDTHDRWLVQVLERAWKVNLKLCQDKCEIKTKKCMYIGHQLAAEGLQPDAQKVAAISRMCEPTCKKDLQHFMGMIRYLAKFIPNLPEKAYSLWNLMKKDMLWQWHLEIYRKPAVNHLFWSITMWIRW